MKKAWFDPNKYGYKPYNEQQYMGPAYKLSKEEIKLYADLLNYANYKVKLKLIISLNTSYIEHISVYTDNNNTYIYEIFKCESYTDQYRALFDIFKGSQQ